MGTARLVLVRHAKSDYPWGVDDHDRPLNERGRRDAPVLGAWLDTHVRWDEGSAPVVLVSTARRAQLTWGLARSAMSARWDGADLRDEPRIYEAAVDDLRAVVAEAAGTADTVLMVGHNPGLAGLIHRLCIDDDLRAEAIAKFPTSAVAVLTAEQPLVDAVAAERAFRVTAFAVPRG